MPLHCFALHDRAKLGLPSQCVDRAEAYAAYLMEMVATENDYHYRGVIAIKVFDDPLGSTSHGTMLGRHSGNGWAALKGTSRWTSSQARDFWC
jgi:hypothetical protein